MFSGYQGNPQQAQDFVNRYQQGDPSQGYSNQEAMQHFQQVVPQLSPEQFQQAAMQSFQNMSPDQRMQFGQMLQQQAQQQGARLPQMQPNMYQDPNALAQMTTQAHQQNPGLLGGLLGGGNQGGQTWETLDPQTRDLFIRQWGQRAQQEWEKENAAAHSPFNNPVAKVAMAGIAAMALKNLTGH
jgi:hypothetical protein